MSFALRYGVAPDNVGGAIEAVSTKLGVVLFVLGGGHMMNLLFLTRLRWRVRLVSPQEQRPATEHLGYYREGESQAKPRPPVSEQKHLAPERPDLVADGRVAAEIEGDPRAR